MRLYQRLPRPVKSSHCSSCLRHQSFHRADRGMWCPAGRPPVVASTPRASLTNNISYPRVQPCSTKPAAAARDAYRGSHLLSYQRTEVSIFCAGPERSRNVRLLKQARAACARPSAVGRQRPTVVGPGWGCQRAFGLPTTITCGLRVRD